MMKIRGEFIILCVLIHLNDIKIVLGREIEMEKKLNINYSWINFFYYALFSSSFAFVSVYLLNKGFDNATIGTVLSVTSLVTIFLQTAFGNYASSNQKVTLQNIMIRILSVIVLSSISLLVIPGNFIFLSFIVITYALTQSIIPLINSLAFIYEPLDIKINYGFGRGIGSLSYAIITLVLGYVVEATNPNVLPFFYVLFTGLLIFSLYNYRPSADYYNYIAQENFPNHETEIKTIVSDGTYLNFLQKYNVLLILNVGFVFMFIAHTIINSFLIQIITPIGGNNSSMGTAIFLGSIINPLSMMAFDKISQKVSIPNLLRISTVVFLIKHVLTYFAPNMLIIYVAQLLQVGAFAIFNPALIQYANKVVEPDDLVRGQSLITVTQAASGVIGNYIGGNLIDYLGISNTLLIGVISTVIGVVIIFLILNDANYSDRKAIYE